MTKYLLVILLSIVSFSLHAQENIDYSAIKLETEADYKNAEPTVLTAANYILSTPANAEGMERMHAIQFILVWMEGTPDYMFDLDAMEKLDNEVDQTTAYLAALSKYVLLNKDTYMNDLLGTKLGSMELFINYSMKNKNNVKQTRKLKKLTNSYLKGELRKELSK